MLSLTRTETRTVVGDTGGRTGYGPHLPSMLRGMFDAWTLMCRHRARIADFLGERAADHVLRVIARPTAEYAGGSEVPFTEDELDQLARGDVPYFFRTADGGPLLAVRTPPGHGPRTGPNTGPRTGPADAPGWGPDRPWPPVAAVREGRKLDLAGLGIALRDAVEHVHGDLGPGRGGRHDPGRGVRIEWRGPREGEVSFDWLAACRRITYQWDEARLRLRIDAPVGDVKPPGDVGGPSVRDVDGVRERLLRLDRIDASLRGPWAAGGFTDTVLEAKLDRLTGTGTAWLRGVVAEHGWPGRALVGAEAAAAAVALLQHRTGDLAFRHECLALIEAAAARGDTPRRDVAYLTDALRRDEGRPQLYGTKFERDAGGGLRPCPIEDPDRVDERRAAVGLGPLAGYAALLAEKYPAPGNGSGDGPGRASEGGGEPA